MPKFGSLAAAFAVVAGSTIFTAGPVFSQTATTDNSGTITTSPNVESDLAIGVPAEEAPNPGETYVKEVFGDWSLRCIVSENTEDPCQMYQLLSDEGGQPIAEFTLFRLQEGGQAAAGATIVVPLETSLQQQLTIKVDDQPAKRYPYAFCNNIGCYARIGLTEADVSSYKLGSVAALSLVPALAPDQRPIIVQMSLSGFTAAFDASSQLEQ